MERRVRTWTERRGTPDLAAYGQRLRREPAELDAFLDRVTINVSHLWRHEDQFEVLRTKILPELAERRRLKIWSAGCSYGAEAYTIAAICREAIPNVAVEIVGTDLDKRMVARAREGHFTAEDARTSPKRAAGAAFRAAAGRRMGGPARTEANGAIRKRGPTAYGGAHRALRRGLLSQYRDLLHRAGA